MTIEDLRLTPAARVLVAEGTEQGSRLMAEYLQSAGHTVITAADGEEALRRIRRDDPEVAILDVEIPRLNAFQLCERVRNHPTTRNIPVLLVVSEAAQDLKIRGLEMGAEDFLSRPINKLDLLARVKCLVRTKRLLDQAETTEHVIFGMAKLLENKVARDGSNAGRLADYACMLGSALSLDEDDLEVLRKAAILHDIGKIAVREEVLLKPGRLSAEEYDEIKMHPEVGERLCGPLRCADEVLPIMRHYRERWDGTGYPDGLRGEQIPIMARILSIADAYDAMLSPRPYRPAMTSDEASANLQEGASRQWDPELVGLFLAVLHPMRECVVA